MVFPLLFPLGDLGWSTGYNKHPNEKKNCFNEKTKYLNEKNKYLNEKNKYPDKKNKCPNEKKKHVQYYLYRLSYRPKNFSPILSGGRLTQQCFCFLKEKAGNGEIFRPRDFDDFRHF